MSYFKKSVGFYLFVCAVAVFGAMLLSRVGSAVAALSSELPAAPVVILDAGHGGEDGGAISVTGVRESMLNLEISQRLNDLLQFLGIQTKMIRNADVSVYTEGETIAQKKVSDIHNRVALVEQTPNAVLVSIHQNQFSEAQYRGAQVFYAKGSQGFAEAVQNILCTQVDPRNHRQCKQAQGIYLLEHISCPSVLIECGFLSNPAEEQLLRDAGYQKKLAAAIACSVQAYLEESHEV